MSLLKDKPLKKCHTDNRKMIDDIHKDIIKGMNSEELNEYYLDNGLLLDKYYRNDNVKNTDNNSGILSYFGKQNNEEEEDNKNNRKEIMSNYMSNIDDGILNQKDDLKNDICESCNSKLYLSDLTSELYCKKCGKCKSILVITDKVSYSDPQSEITYYTYKRINHFNEWLAQFQAKESTDIPSEIYTEIFKELKKIKITDYTKIDYKCMRQILKNVKQKLVSKYLDHYRRLKSN